VAHLAPLADYLARKVDVPEIDRGRVVVAESVSEMATLIDQGQVDLYFGDPLPLMAVSEVANVRPQLCCSPPETHSVFFARKNAGVAGLEDLGGKMVAFDSPLSTFGYLLPKLVLSSKGGRLLRRDAPSTSVDADTIGYVFSGDDENTVLWVLRGKVAAGAVRSDRYEKLVRSRSDAVDVVYRSIPLPAEVAAVRATLPSVVATKLQKLLQDIQRDSEGRELMQRVGGSPGCEPLTGEASINMENALPFLRNEFGLP
jgi:phosphonate transport system substrate-binding protein